MGRGEIHRTDSLFSEVGVMAQTVSNPIAVMKRCEMKYLLDAEKTAYLKDHLEGHMQVDAFGLSSIASLYFDTEGNHCWTKPWFNDRQKGEPAIEITRKQAIAFINDQISKDSWLTRFWPKQMSIYHKAIAQTRQQILGL